MATIRALPVLLLISFVASATEIRVKHANPLTPDSVYTETELQTAIDAVGTVCGDIIEIEPGAAPYYTYPYILRGPWLDPALGGPATRPSYAKDCASSGKYITIRSSKAYQLTPGKRVGAADAAYLAYVGQGGIGYGCTLFHAERASSYWRLQGLELSAPTINCDSGGNSLIMTTYQEYNLDYALGRLDQFPNHITIDQCWLHGLDGYRVRDGIMLDGNMVTLSNSTVENLQVGKYYNAANGSVAVMLASGRGPVQIINNKLSSGSIDLFSGGEITATLRGVEYVEVLNNWLYRPYKWLDWSGTTNPTPSSPCPVDPNAHGATYRNTANSTYWECQGATPGTWTSISAGTYNALVASNLPSYQKNVIEFKRASNFHLEGNLLDHSAPWSFDNQVGTCLLLSLLDGPSGKHENILMENNVCKHAGWGFGTSYALFDSPGVGIKNPYLHTNYWANGGKAQHNIIIRNNLYHHMGENMYTNPGFGSDCYADSFSCGTGFARFVNNVMDATVVDHNTFESRLTTFGNDYARNTGIRFERSFDAYTWDGLTPTNQRVTNNIIAAGSKPISNGSGHTDANAISQTMGKYAEITGNVFVDALQLGMDWLFPDTNNRKDTLIYHCTPRSDGCAYTTANDSYPPNCIGSGKAISGDLRPGTCMFAEPANFGFTSYPEALTLQSGSVLKASALDGKDLGADLNTVGWATAGAEAGTMAPYLAMKIRLIRPGATSAFVRFSAIDTSSCTVAARVYGFPLSSPVATATVNTGDLDRAATLTGLTANTKYGLKVTCAGSYYREGEFKTP